MKCTKCFIDKDSSEFYFRYNRNKLSTECKTCFRLRMGNRHQQHKNLLVAELGGACNRCNYNISSRVLVFHHLDPSQKKFGIAKNLSIKLEILRSEVSKCILLCPNCHAEKHLGLW